MILPHPNLNDRVLDNFRADIAIRWVVALKSEAQAICEYFKMTLVSNEDLYPVYRDLAGVHWLIISGIGRVNTAAAVIYLYQKSSAPNWAGWINIGVAGHRFGDIGSIYLVDKIIEKSTKKTFFPRFIHKSAVNKISLCTVDKPESDYESNSLFDMEGSSFFQVVDRLTCQQLIVVLKVISDGPGRSFKELTKTKIRNLIWEKIDIVDLIVKEIEQTSKKEYFRLKDSEYYAEIIKKWNFSHSRKIQLKSELKRWETIYPGTNLMKQLDHCSDATSVLSHLANQLDSYVIDWPCVD